MNFNELAESGYSCRKLSDKKVDRALVNQIIDTTIKLPTVVNLQPYKIFLWTLQRQRKIFIK